jgi:oligoendopeptidase F
MRTYPQVNPLEWSTVQPYVDCLLQAELHAGNVDAWLQQWSDLTAVLTETIAQVYREVSENTADADAEKRFLVMVESTIPEATKAEQALRQKLLAVGDYTPPPDTVLVLKRFRTEAGLFREENIPLQTELMKLGNDYDKIIGAMTVDWEGTQETIPQALLHLREKDRDTRERAWRLVMDRYLADRDRLNELYLAMLARRRQVARNAGFSDFRAYQWQAMMRFDYTPADAFTFHAAIEEKVVPLARKLYARQAAKLNLLALRPWDVDVDPEGEPLRPFANVAELEEGGYRIFQRVDPELAAYFSLMREGYLDLASRPNKAPGGYCNGFPVSQRPYIFMNAVGTHDDVQTLLHEGGHAFHFMESARQPLIWNLNGPMEFSEVASMAMELLSIPYLERSQGGFYDTHDARRAYAEKLRGIVQFLPYMAVVDGFQHWVYTEAPEDVSAADLDAKWSQLWDRFLPDLDLRGLQAQKETGWHRKGHIFGSPFYYIEYGLAEVGALQVWRNALRNQTQAVADYRSALAVGDTRPLPELFRAAGARFAFDSQTLGELMDLIERKLGELEG